jgi:hypothetical protein
MTPLSTFAHRMPLAPQVLVPVPDYTAKCHIMVTSGKAKYDATKKAIVSLTLSNRVRMQACLRRCGGVPGSLQGSVVLSDDSLWGTPTPAPTPTHARPSRPPSAAATGVEAEALCWCF